MKEEIIFTKIPKTLLNLYSKIMVDNVIYKNLKEWSPQAKIGENILIINPIQEKKLRIIVKESALHDTPFFQYHKMKNNNIPIPLTEMEGIKLEETEKSVKMDLWDKEHKIHWVGWLVKSWIIEQEEI